MAELSNCPHCGSAADFTHEPSGAIFARCQNVNCGIRTPAFGASIEYGARQKVADIWNASTGGNEWPDWVQPTGAHDAYAYGAKVSHNGKHWVSNVANNVWAPGVSGWRES